MGGLVSVDFETFFDSDYSLRKMAPWAYVHDPRFQCYQVALVGVDVSGNPVEYVGPPAEAPWARLTGCRIVYHNAGFDRLVESRVRGELGFPNFERWNCTANLAAYLQTPRNLKGAAKELLGREVSKDYRQKAKGKRWEMMPGILRAELAQAGLEDARACYELYAKHAHRWPDEEQELSRLTYEWAWRGVTVDWPAVEAAVELLGAINWSAEQAIPWAGAAPVLSMDAVRRHCAAEGIPAPRSLAASDDLCEEWLDTYGDSHPFVNAMRAARRSNTFRARFQKLLQMRREDGTVPTDLKYFGATLTGRWSGASGFNFQNPAKSPLLFKGRDWTDWVTAKGELDEAFRIKRETWAWPDWVASVVDMRGVLIPRPGKKFLVIDLAQIEPRCLAWLGRNTRFLEEVAGGVPLYEAHARETMGWAGGNLKAENPGLYALAKARVLGLGYGCGKDKFALVARLMAGLELSPEVASEQVASFRKSNPHITGLWSRCDRALRNSAGEREPLELQLPNGRKLRYFDVGLPPGKRGSCVGRVVLGGPHRRLYGALLVENLTQAMARDVFADRLLALYRSGFSILWHTHDEVILEADASDAECELDQAAYIMQQAPEWAHGLPLDVEGSVMERYGK